MIARRRLAQMLRTSPLALPVLFAAPPAGAQPADWQAKPYEFRFEEHAPYPEPEKKKVDPDAPELPPPPREPKVIYAPEPRAPAFGQRGQWVLTASGGGSNGAGIASTTVANSEATFLSASFQAGLDYFVVDHLSLGFNIGASHTDDKTYASDESLLRTTSNQFQAGVRVGAQIPLGEAFSFYPQLTLGFETWKEDQGPDADGSLPAPPGSVAGTSTSRTGGWGYLYAPIILHAAPHFFVGLGPELTHHFASVNGSGGEVAGQGTTAGVAFILGGWWGNDKPADAPSPEIPTSGARHHRFGDAGTWVITGATNASALATSYSGPGGSRTDVMISPGFDYFLVDRFSIGLDSSLTYERVATPSNGGASVVSTASSFGVAPRMGLAIPLADTVSFYWRVEVGGGPIHYSQTPEGAGTNGTTSRVWFDVELPVIVHVADHFFVGAGPSLYSEFKRDGLQGGSFPLSTLGASVLVGGWL